MPPRPDSRRERRPLVFCPASEILAHVGRSLLVAREVQRRGHRVILAGTPTYLQNPALVRPDEFELYPIPDFSRAEGLEILRSLRRIPSRAEIERNIAAELEMLDRITPAAAVVDFRPTMFVSARARRIPVISLVGGVWLYQYAAKPYRALRTYQFYDTVRRLAGDSAERVMPFLVRLAMRYKMLPFALAYRRHGLAPKWTPWEMIVGDYNLILDTELLSPMKPLPENFRRVGPIFWTADVPLPDRIRKLDRRTSIIYVTLGSTGHGDLFRHLLRVLGETEYQVVMSTGGQVAFAPGEIPRNIYVEAYVAGLLTSEVADLVIHHGGAGTVYQTLSAGRPSITIATHFEQELLGAAIEDQGAGIFLTMREVMADPRLLNRAIERIFANHTAYRANAERLREEVLKYDGVKMAADAIEEFVARL